MENTKKNRNDLLNIVCVEFAPIFEREMKKDPYFHFGYKNWDDVSIEILEHIYDKLSTFDQNRPLKPWLRKVIKNQIINKKRNYSTRNKIEKRDFTLNPAYFDFLEKKIENLPDLSQQEREPLQKINQLIKAAWLNLNRKDKKLAISYFKKRISPYQMTENKREAWCAFARIHRMKENLLKEFKRNGIHIREKIK